MSYEAFVNLHLPFSFQFLPSHSMFKLFGIPFSSLSLHCSISTHNHQIRHSLDLNHKILPVFPPQCCSANSFFCFCSLLRYPFLWETSPAPPKALVSSPELAVLATFLSPHHTVITSLLSEFPNFHHDVVLSCM